MKAAKYAHAQGAIYAEEAYAQGKMLDNSSWYGVLPRGITPSDIDAVFDNSGAFVLSEWSSSKTVWAGLETGQRLAYENLIKKTSNVAAVCKHSVPIDRQIDTRHDCDWFQVMWWDGSKLCFSIVFEGSRWSAFVESWFKEPMDVVRHLEKNRYKSAIHSDPF